MNGRIALLYLGCAIGGGAIGHWAAPEYPPSALYQDAQSYDGATTINARFVSNDFGVLPRTPPLAMGVYDVYANPIALELIDYGDPIPPYLTMFVQLHSRATPKIQFNLETGETFEYDEVMVTYVRADVFVELTMRSASISTQRDTTPADPIPQPQYDFPPSVAIMSQTGVELIDQLICELEATAKELAQPVHNNRSIRPGTQNHGRRHKMTLGA